MSARAVLILSLGLNLVLAAWVAAKLGRAPASSAAQAASVEPPAGSIPVWRVQRTNVIEVATNRVDAPGFHWSQIETNDYDAFAANLRATGCPENTVRDLILADVEKLYAGRMADAEEPEFFWATESQRLARERRVAETQRALAEEKRALLLRLAGVDWSAKAVREWIQQKEMAFIMGFLPDETVLRLIEAGARVERRMDAFHEETQRVVIDTDEPKLDAIVAESRRDLESCVTPAEAGELMLRAYDLVTGFVHEGRLAGVKLTGTELKVIAGIGARQTDLVDLVLRHELDDRIPDSDLEDILKRPNAAVDAEIHQLLGDERFAAYARSKDEEFRAYARAAERHQLPTDAAIKAYDIRRTAEAAARELKSNRGLAPEQRRAALEAMRREVGQAMQSAVGAAALKDFFRPDGGWARGAFAEREAGKP